ncbi:uncharacterized protein LAESUDRAFT_290826 [Laetiporus sulphureus 93-53]|uniref:DUF6533 domain-containing protein n=1 Tax=Laetiporus sulphureus 93-53 TaxID=1314785 RepID=A0A165DDZ6_9APHY|nr:uncharacterized protein LAESUDRAFT_290826 [Laetiporus sulphureus 93-53]KZT04670.1 hypothetical protein LAESUDRAFT_290826 [Laetiporus sulphureus 93-53]
MSSDQSALAEDASTLQGFFPYQFCMISAAVVVLYEYAITLPEEVALVWLKPLSVTKVAVLSNRYLSLCLGIVDMLAVLPLYSTLHDCRRTCPPLLTISIRRCLVISELQSYLVPAVEAVIADQSDSTGSNSSRLIHLTYRTYCPAYLCHLRPQAGARLDGIDTRASTSGSQHLSEHTILRCIRASYSECSNMHGFISHLFQSDQPVMLLPARICPLISDVILLAVTWYKTFKVAREARTAGVQAPLAILLLRDGTLYFVTISLLNVLEIVLAFTVQLVEVDAYVYVSLFGPQMSSILFTRFVFNLRQVSSDLAVSSERPLSTVPQTRTLEFSSKLVGNMDADLDFGRDVVGDSEDEMEGELEEEIMEEQFDIDLGQPDGDADVREVSVWLVCAFVQSTID